MRKKLRTPTCDREGPDPLSYAILAHKVGIRQSITPEGFLLCEDVAFARVGWMIYAAGETPIEIDPALGYAEVYRDAEDLFSDETVQSFNGKAIVDEHPPVDVTPENWKQLARGIALNVRVGEGFDNDCLMCDMLIMDAQTIAAVRGGKREVSAGYSADYQQTGPGKGLQTDIIGNHIALVERGRCGPRCSIGDHHHEGTNDMGTKTTGGLAPKRRAVLLSQVRDVMAELTGDTGDEVETGGAEESHTHIHIHQGGAKDDDPVEGDPPADDPAAKGDPTEARFAQIEKSISDLSGTVKSLADAVTAMTTPEDGGGDETDETDETGDTADEFPPKKEPDEDDKKKEKKETKDKGKTTDSAALETGYKEVIELAEVLVPGFRMSTFDAKASRATTIDAMCNARRLAMTACYATSDGKTLVDAVNGGKSPDLVKMDCRDLAVLFKGAAGARKLVNNQAATKDANKLPNGTTGVVSKVPKTPAELNAFYKEFHAKSTTPTTKH